MSYLQCYLVNSKKQRTNKGLHLKHHEKENLKLVSLCTCQQKRIMYLFVFILKKSPPNFVLYTRDLDEVIRRANATRYGLAAGVFTRNLDTANTLTRALRAGTVWINCFDVFDAAIPFGGYKMSGIGREKGIYSLNNYLQVKAVITPLKKAAWL